MLPEPSPLLARRGGCASKKKVRSIRSGADGVVVQVQKHFCLILNHHPVRSIKGSFAIFLLMSRPPLLARRGDVAVRQVCPGNPHPPLLLMPHIRATKVSEFLCKAAFVPQIEIT